MYFLPDTWIEKNSHDPPNWEVWSARQGFKVPQLNRTEKRSGKEETPFRKVCEQSRTSFLPLMWMAVTLMRGAALWKHNRESMPIKNQMLVFYSLVKSLCLEGKYHVSTLLWRLKSHLRGLRLEEKGVGAENWVFLLLLYTYSVWILTVFGCSWFCLLCFSALKLRKFEWGLIARCSTQLYKIQIVEGFILVLH